MSEGRKQGTVYLTNNLVVTGEIDFNTQEPVVRNALIHYMGVDSTGTRRPLVMLNEDHILCMAMDESDR